MLPTPTHTSWAKPVPNEFQSLSQSPSPIAKSPSNERTTGLTVPGRENSVAYRINYRLPQGFGIISPARKTSVRKDYRHEFRTAIAIAKNPQPFDTRSC